MNVLGTCPSRSSVYVNNGRKLYVLDYLREIKENCPVEVLSREMGINTREKNGII